MNNSIPEFKIIHISDTHLGLSSMGVENPKTGMNTREMDGFQALDQMIEFAFQNNVKLVVHSGDVMNTKTVSQNTVNAFYSRIKRLSDANIDVFILQGNHDSSKNLSRLNGLDLAATLNIPNVYVTRGGDYTDLGYIQIVTVSYWNTAEEVSEQINEFAKQVDWERPAVLVVHLQIDYPDFPGSFKADLPFVPVATLTSYPWTLIQAGHVHKPKVLNQNPFAFYVGSLVRCSATEEHDKKGFWISEIEGLKLKSIEQIEVDCLRFLTIKSTMADLKTMMEKRIIDFSKAIVRIKIKETEDPIDDAFIREKFSTAFKCIVEKESDDKPKTKLNAVVGISMDAYLQSYFEKDDDKDELMALIEELKEEATLER